MGRTLTFDPGQATYTVRDRINKLYVTVEGAEGGDSGSGQVGYTLYDGGHGGYADAELAVSPGETITVYVGDAGSDGTGTSGGSGGSSPLAAGGDGGDPFDDSGGGGGGGGATAIEAPTGDRLYCDAGGGAQGAGSDDGQAGGGGGGGRGGAGGAAGGSSAEDGQDAEGSGLGGDGGLWGSSNFAGEDGGVAVDGTWTVTTSTDGGAPAGSGTVVIVEGGPDSCTVSIDSHTDTAVTLALSSSSDADGYYIYRSTTQGFSPTTGNRIADVSRSGSSQTYTDSGLTQGTTYYYEIEAYNTEGVTADTAAQTTDAPAPTLDAFDAVDAAGDGLADQLDYDWTREGTDEVAYRALYSTDGGGTWTQANGDLAGTATSYTTGDRLDGTTHTGKVVAVYPDVTRESGTLTATTELPDTTVGSITPVDASVENELTPQNADVADTGNVRYQIREADVGDTYGSDIVVAQGGADPTFDNANAGVLDGEEYDIRARSETPDVTGAWVTVSEVTKLPADTGLTNTDREL